jgi:cysteinyl-tRNA synthetase
VRVDNEKMSKSLGNFFTIREVLAKYEPETVRFFLLRTHYRTALNYSDAHLDDARSGLKRLYTALDLMPEQAATVSVDWSEDYAKRFHAAMDEDFGTPEAIAVLFDLASEINRSKSADLAGLLKGLGACLGLLQQMPRTYLQSGATISDEQISTLIAERTAAKSAKDFSRADAVRKELLGKGIVLKDSPTGTTWEVAQ